MNDSVRPMRLRFLSSNKHKIQEAIDILSGVGVEVVPVDTKIEEIQSADINMIVADKAAKAFHQVGHPLFVEQTGLFIRALNDFPGGLTQVFWDTLEADRIAQLFGKAATDPVVLARTVIGYCDGRQIQTFTGEIAGQIAFPPRGDRSFQWDCIFLPDGYTETFAEMGAGKKNTISMRRKALEKMAAELKRTK